MYIASFVNITSKAWALPILSSLHGGVAGRQAPLLAATGASRTAFAQSMDHLIEHGWLQRNPGYGHPLRPEFCLTEIGKEAAALAHKVQLATSPEDQRLLRKSWTLPVLASLHRPRRFNEIRHGLRTITDRALSQSLKSMEASAWIERRVDDTARPPRALYSAVNTGQTLSQITGPEIAFTRS